MVSRSKFYCIDSECLLNPPQSRGSSANPITSSSVHGSVHGSVCGHGVPDTGTLMTGREGSEWGGVLMDEETGGGEEPLWGVCNSLS